MENTEKRTKFLPDVVLLVLLVIASSSVWFAPNFFIPKLDSWSYATIDSLPVGKVTIVLLLLLIYSFRMHYRSNKVKLSGLSQLASQKATCIALAALLVCTGLTTIGVTSYKLRLLDSIFTAQELQLTYQQQRSIRPRMDSPMNFEHTVGYEAMERLRSIIKVRTGEEVDLNDWDKSYEIIENYLSQLEI